MNLITSDNSSKHVKKRLNRDQVQLLESSFDAIKKLDRLREFKLAREIGVPPRHIAIWYQNKRARWKSQSLELNYIALEVRLEAALTEKKQLVKQVCGLRGEQKRAQEMLFASRLAQAEAQPQVNQAWIPPVSSLSSCCDEGGGSSNLDDDVVLSGNWASAADQANVLYHEELYACLMMNGRVQMNGITIFNL